MQSIVPPSADKANDAASLKPSLSQRLARIIREVLAAWFWFYVAFKLFVYDFDAYVLQKYFPDAAWLLDLKFFFILGCLAISFALFQTKTVLLWLLYIVTYPVIILCWKLPYFIFRNRSWVLAFAIVNLVISLFRSIKYGIISAALWLISFALIFNSNDRILLSLASAVLIGLLLLTYVRRFILAFKATALFETYKKLFTLVRTGLASSNKLDENYKNLPLTSLTETQLKKWTSNLETLTLHNRACLIAAKALRDYQNSGINVASGIFTSFMLIIVTTFSFAVINLALYKIDPKFFETTGEVSFFTFFYYSMNAFVFNSIKEVAPVSYVSQSVLMTEYFFALFLVAIFVSLIVPFKNARYAQELNDTVATIETEGRLMESFIRSEYRINSIDEALAELQRLEAGLARFLLYLTEQLK